MRVVMFYHSLLSDWNHGNAHFLRGIATELQSRGHEVVIYEPRKGWSLTNLIAEHGIGPLDEFHRRYPGLFSIRYDAARLNLDRALDGADLAIVHEWNDRDLIERIGVHRRSNNHYRLLFHDTHHRSVTDPGMAAIDLSNYDGVLAYGEVIRRIYLDRGWARAAWTWHEAADTRVFRPWSESDEPTYGKGDLVWIGNWGDDERTAELHEFLMEPARRLKLAGSVYGVRYPAEAIEALIASGFVYGSWLPNYKVPEVFARFKVTIHVPRRPYVEALPGIPTIRPFEAMACGIPLICSPWEDSEGLFNPGRDYLVARDGREMEQHIRTLLYDHDAARELAGHGRKTILSRHTCAHRVDELLAIARQMGVMQGAVPVEPPANGNGKKNGKSYAIATRENKAKT